MRIVRLLSESGPCYAVEREGHYSLCTGSLAEGFTPTDVPVESLGLLAPVEPTVIFAIGLNYREHAEEMSKPIPEYPVVTMKNLSSLQAPGGAIELPVHLPSDQVDYECELAVVIGKPCKNASKETALDYVAGYTAANDVSARDWQQIYSGGQWCKGKSFDTFCPLGPALVTADEIPDPDNLVIRTELNGECVQASNTSDMIFSVAELIAFLSGSMTLPAGTLILTGTPPGVGIARKPQRFLQAGDEVTIEIEKIGRLTNPVVLEPMC
ncbi:fumarylacetoacetate hydrolase family protein [Coraliomargarita parva]|uniref:fumarylacetoacetate hydrolase family protein n=1 Tax=Coraliomargarita parva TaxID=3014050 RepID=UPI0022B4454F|nr:fumarylacetoacetate hydrolase family protein [Coraliomargarita parva]